MALEAYLLEYEELVFNLLEDYFSKNKPFDMDKILPFLLNKLSRNSINLNKAGIKKIVASLLKQKLIVEGTILTRNKVLSNEKRQLIYNYVKQNPGTYFSRIVIILEIPNHEVTWHLNILQKFGFIDKRSFNKHELFFKPDLNFPDVIVNYFLLKKKSQRIIDYLKTNDYGLTKTQITKDLQMHPYTVDKYLENLENYRLIFKNKKDNKILYFLNEKYIK